MKAILKIGIGERFNRWIIQKEIFGYRTKSGIPLRKFLCKCDCGNEKEVVLGSIVNGKSKSCGCLQKENHYKKHSFCGTRFYNTYRNITSRCKMGGVIETKWHGDKGIKCKWNSFEEFKKDMYENYLQHCQEFGEKNTSIDRVDSNKDYCKENCKWATKSEQNRNMKSNIWLKYKGKRMILKDWCTEFGLKYSKVHNRIKYYNWSTKEALELKKR